MAAGQRIIACANPSTGRAGNGRTRYGVSSPSLSRRTFPGARGTAYPSRRMRLADDRSVHLGQSRPATNRPATETNAAERCVAVDEAGASAGASPLNAVFGRRGYDAGPAGGARPTDEHATAYPLRRSFSSSSRAPSRRTNERPAYPGQAGPAKQRLSTGTGAAERCVAVDEAGASAGASPLNAVLGRPWMHGC